MKIVQEVLKRLVLSTDLMPYTLRAMMKILVMNSDFANQNESFRSQSGESSKNKPKLGRN